MNTPEELIDKLVCDWHFPFVSICQLHKPCEKKPRCLQVNDKLLINFDDVKTTFCSEKGKPSCSSVDGLGAKSGKLLFVEIEGWIDFLNHNSTNVEKKIEKQVSGYDFAKKLTDSFGICNELADDKDFLSNVKIAYIIVTDISIEENPLQSILSNLNSLGQTSSNLESLCNKYMLAKINKISNVDTYYKSCKDFDAFVVSL